MESPRSDCILLFSGGRDSTIAVFRLLDEFERLTLATVVSPHLIGIQRVALRIRELSLRFPRRLEWQCYSQPKFTGSDPLIQATCLPCQRSYVSVGIALCEESNCGHLALGYAGYQNTWPEQTPLAASVLSALLEERNIELHLPAADLRSKEEAKKELRARGVCDGALEQKCLKQITNIALDPQTLRGEIARWEKTIREEVGQILNTGLERLSPRPAAAMA